MTNKTNIILTDDLRQAVVVIKAAIQRSQARALQGVNTEMLSLYYGIGHYVSEHSRVGKWGTGAITAISDQLQKEMPGLTGFSASNIRNMRQFYETWVDFVNRQPLAGELPVDETELLAEIRQPLADEFEPAHLGQLSYYLTLLDKQTKQPHENPSVGLVLCREMDKTVVELAVQDYTKPMGVATFRLGQDEPEEYKGVLPNLSGLHELMQDVEDN